VLTPAPVNATTRRPRSSAVSLSMCDSSARTTSAEEALMVKWGPMLA
jgi:hypothetical protein